MSKWFPDADNTSQNFERNYPSSIKRRPTKLVIHTTEGSTWPGYNNGASAPHLTVKPDFLNRRALFRQHYPMDRYARALRDSRGGVSTNVGPGPDEMSAQVEIIATAGWASAENPRAPYHVRHKSTELPDWFWRDFARLIAWLHTDHGMSLNVAENVFPAWNRAEGHRMSPAQWEAFEGICGHVHVPENTHTDPGAINARRIVDFAKALINPPKPLGPWADGVLRTGDRGEVVKRYQSLMMKIFPSYESVKTMIRKGGADGIYGPATENVTKEFQRRVGITADGIIGKVTLSELAKFGVRISKEG